MEILTLKKLVYGLKNLNPLKHYKEGDQIDIDDPEAQITHVDKGEFITFSSGKRMPKWYNISSSKDRAKLRSKTFPASQKQWLSNFLVK